MKADYMAVDQYGETIHALGEHPRKALLRRMYRKHATRIYQDKKDGSRVHVGYIIAGRWFILYEVKPYEKAA